MGDARDNANTDDNEFQPRPSVATAAVNSESKKMLDWVKLL